VPHVPDFSPFAAAYAAARPSYPPDLFEWLARVAPAHDVAWDVATGNGQAAVGLAVHFDRVIATDISPQQLANAAAHKRVEYRVGRAEASGLAAGSIDLVTVAAAIHWLDLPPFYAEAQRVLRPGGVLAAWTYHVARLDSQPLQDVLEAFYMDVISPYFAPGVKLVDERYETLELPGEPLEPPPLWVSVRWSADQVLRYVRTWSGVEEYRKATGKDPVVAIERAVKKALGGDAPVTLRFPLYVRASRL
jgi:SAM-dependent methyltransferase